MKMLITFPFGVKQVSHQCVEVNVAPLQLDVLTVGACEHLDKQVGNVVGEEIAVKLATEYQRLIIMNQLNIRVIPTSESEQH